MFAKISTDRPGRAFVRSRRFPSAQTANPAGRME